MNQRNKTNNLNNNEEYLQITTDNGLLKKIIKEGTGNIVPENVIVIVHYTGKLINGNVFDSSKTRGIPFEFNIGQREGNKKNNKI